MIISGAHVQRTNALYLHRSTGRICAALPPIDPEPPTTA
jgi:hypothetical protein